MFNLQQLKAIHAKVKSGRDFPAYVQEIKQSGVSYYDFAVKDGSTVYHGITGATVSSDPGYAEKAISTTPKPETVRQIIADHQQGKNDFLTFCSLVAEAGVAKWRVDTEAMLCTYFDLSGSDIVAEPIPQGSY